jgi:hypothetical protein
MNYLTIEEIHKQLRLDPEFTEDDEILNIYGDAAESFLEAHLNCSLDDIAAENSGQLPTALKQALLMLVDYSYDSSGSGDVKDIPQPFWILVNPWKVYSIA